MTSSRVVDIFLTLMFGVLGVIAIIMVGEFPFRDQLFPLVASGMILFFGLASAAAIIAALRKGGAGSSDEPETRPSEGRIGDGIPGVHQDIKVVLRIFGFIILLVLLVLLVGHMVAIPIFIFLYMKMNNEKLWLGVVCAVAFWGFTWFILVKTMNVAFPVPYLVDWLGL